MSSIQLLTLCIYGSSYVERVSYFPYALNVMFFCLLTRKCSMYIPFVFKQNVDLTNNLYTLPWYYLHTELQLLITNAMNNVQNGPLYTIGPFEPLNFETMAMVSEMKVSNQKRTQKKYFKLFGLFHSYCDVFIHF